MQLAHPADAERGPIAWRGAAIGWGVAIVVAATLAVLFGQPLLGPAALAAALGIAAIVVLGDLAAVPAEGAELSPAPAVLTAGVVVAGWPAALAGALVGTLLPAVLRRAAGQRQELARSAAARTVLVLLLAPLGRLSEDVGAVGQPTPRVLIGLALTTAVIYAVELAGRDAVWFSARALRRRLRSLGWYPALMAGLGGTLAALWYVNPWTLPIGLGMLVAAQALLRTQMELREARGALRDLEERHAAGTGRLERLQSLSTAIIATRDMEAMLRILCERLAALLGAPAGWVVLLDEAGAPRLMASHNIDSLAAHPDSPLSHEAYTALLRRAQVVLNADERRHELAPAAAHADAIRWPALLSIPLVTEQRPLGAICLVLEQLRGLDADERRVLASFARQAAVTLENARLFDELRHKQSELIQSSKLAAVGTFAAGIAHEFNNLLGGMLGYAQLGRADDDLGAKDKALDVVVQACVRGRGITRGLLTFARRSEHRRELSHLADAIDETMTLVEIDLRKAQIAVVRQVEAVPPIVCDLGQMSQVLLNLITNARDAMRPDGGTLTVGLRERRGAIELSVSDTGSGIADEVRDRLFEPFVTTKGALGGSQTPGTGLGLSISYGIVKDHGGEIVVQSAAGQGTTLTVRLPITA